MCYFPLTSTYCCAIILLVVGYAYYNAVIRTLSYIF